MFFDDWYLYCIKQGEREVYSLFKMREQEKDRSFTSVSDGDTPGVTVCFVSLDIQILCDCIRDPSAANRKALGVEINRVVASRKQSHHPALKQYFVRPEAKGSYLMAEAYVRFIASLASNGKLQVPDRYATIYQSSLKSNAGRKITRIPEFLEANNRNGGRVICDHSHIFLQDPGKPDVFEKKAILATHTGNVSIHSFAAEVRYHACFLSWYWKLPLPFIGGSVYGSAIRADMTIDDKEFEGPAPYYDLESKWVRLQEKHHSET